jgi:hypothetical protein
MATRPRHGTCEERVAVLTPEPVDRLIALASVAMRPELVSTRCLSCILNEFRALKAVLH